MMVHVRGGDPTTLVRAPSHLRLLRLEAKNSYDSRAEQLRSLGLTKRRRLLTAGQDEGIQATSQHGKPSDLRSDPRFFPAMRLENGPRIDDELCSRIARRHIREKRDEPVFCQLE
jgi:hypothetical protein